jgi:hypothetical protein
MFWMIPLFLLVMGIGYFVALKATEEIGFLKHLGNGIGGLMIIGGILGLALTAYFSIACYAKYGSQCPFQKTPAMEQPASAS